MAFGGGGSDSGSGASGMGSAGRASSGRSGSSSSRSSSSGFSFGGLAGLASAIGDMFGGVFGGVTSSTGMNSVGQKQAAAAQDARQAANMDRTRDSNSQRGGPADLQNDKNSVRAGIIAKKKKAPSLYSATNGLTGSASQRTAGSGGALAGDEIKSVGLGV